MRLVMCVLLAVVAGCSQSRSGSAPLRDSNVVTSEELSRHLDAPDLYTAILRLRPQFLRPRSSPNIRGQQDPIRVYVAASPAADLEMLRSVKVDQVARVRWMGARDATTRYGTGHGSGAIVVELR